MALDPVVGAGVHLTFLKPVPINPAWSKTFIWTPRSTFYDTRELSYTNHIVDNVVGAHF